MEVVVDGKLKGRVSHVKKPTSRTSFESLLAQSFNGAIYDPTSNPDRYSREPNPEPEALLI